MRRNIQLHIQGNQNQVMVGLDHSTNFLQQTIEGAQRILNQPSTNEITIIQNQSGFQPYDHLFQKHIQDHIPLKHPLQHLLLLADRLLIHVQHDDLKEELRSLPKQLQQIQENKPMASTPECEQRAAQQWLETIHTLLFPEKWENTKDYIDEKQIWNDLGLLSNNTDLDIEDRSHFEALLQAQSLSTNSCSYLLYLLIYTLDKHYDALRNALRSVVLRQQPIQENPYFQILKEERELHLQKYVDRFEPLHTVKEILNTNQGKYLLLTGQAGIGKTAFISKLSQELASSFKPVNPNAPWLPNIILHYCKQLKTPKEVLQTWLSQANLLLVNKLNLPHFSLHSNDHDAYQMIRNAIYQILHQLTLECGEIIFLIDALDELALPLESLNFFPQKVPDQAKVIISARKGSQTETWLMDNRQVLSYELPPLKRDEIPRFTNLDDETEKEFHDNLWEKSKGWTLYISAAAQELRDHGGDTQKVKVNHVHHFYEQQLNKWTSLDHKRNNQILWEILGLLAIFEAACPLTLAEIQSYLRSLNYEVKKQELKSLLAHVGDQVSGIQSDKIILQINSFAKHVREQCWTEHEYREFLVKIINWLGTDSSISIQMVTNFIVNYNLFEEYTPLFNQFTTLLKENNIERLFQIGLYNHLTYRSVYKSIPRFVEELIKIPANQGNLKAIFLMSQISRKRSNKLFYNLMLKEGLKEKNTTLEQLFKNDPIITEYLKKQSELVYQLATDTSQSESSVLICTILGCAFAEWFLYDEAIHWLRKAANQNDSFAMMLIGEILIEKEHYSEGKEWIQKAANAGEAHAMYLLENELILDSKYWSNRTLNRITDLLLEPYSLSNSHLQMSWINRIAEANDVEIMTEEFNKWLVELEETNEQTIEWLTKIANYSGLETMHLLDHYLINGKYSYKNVKEGIQLLQKAANAEDIRAMYLLGCYLIWKNFSPNQVEEGIQWLQKAANAGNTSAMYFLGRYLIEGEFLPTNIEEDVQWIQTSAKERMEKFLPIDIQEGTQWLQKAAYAKNRRAMFRLGYYLVEGKFLPINIQEGAQWLQKAADLGDPDAMYLLAHYLINGVELPINVEKGEEWLQKAADLEHAPSQEKLDSPSDQKRRKLQREASKGDKWAIFKYLFILIEFYFSYEKYTIIKNRVLSYKDCLPWLCYWFVRAKLYIQKIDILKRLLRKSMTRNGLHYKLLSSLFLFLRAFLFMFSLLFLTYLIIPRSYTELYSDFIYYSNMIITIIYIYFIRMYLLFKY